jgi:hypothetical protein
MTTPLIKENERDDKEWKRRARDSVNAIAKRLTGTDTTAKRPVPPVIGQMYYDTTLSKPIWWSGAAWKDAAGTTV